MNNSDYRKQLLERTVSAAKEFQVACISTNDPYKPIEEGGWNVHQLAAHTRDVDKLVYGLRAGRTFTEERPAFTNFDGEAYMAANYDPKESLTDMLDGFVRSVNSLTETLQQMPENAWNRLSSHETDGDGLTLQIWIERGLKHIQEHLATVKKAS